MAQSQTNLGFLKIKKAKSKNLLKKCPKFGEKANVGNSASKY